MGAVQCSAGPWAPARQQACRTLGAHRGVFVLGWQPEGLVTGIVPPLPPSLRGEGEGPVWVSVGVWWRAGGGVCDGVCSAALSLSPWRRGRASVCECVCVCVCVCVCEFVFVC